MIDRTPAIGRWPPPPLKFFRPTPLLVAHQHPSRLVPVGQHPALTYPAVDPVLVPGGALGVAVDQAPGSLRAQHRLPRSCVDDHDLFRLAPLLDLSPRPPPRHALPAL